MFFPASIDTSFIYSADHVGDMATQDILNLTTDKIIQSGYSLTFAGMTNDIFATNLAMIDTQLPLILSHLLLHSNCERERSVARLTQALEDRNPLQLEGLATFPTFYQRKMKRFLLNIALGMNPTSVWNENLGERAIHHIVTEEGKIVTFNAYQLGELQQFLYTHAEIDSPNASMHDAEPFVCHTGRLFFRLQLGIRLIRI